MANITGQRPRGWSPRGHRRQHRVVRDGLFYCRCSDFPRIAAMDTRPESWFSNRCRSCRCTRPFTRTATTAYSECNGSLAGGVALHGPLAKWVLSWHAVRDVREQVVAPPAAVADVGRARLSVAFRPTASAALALDQATASFVAGVATNPRQSTNSRSCLRARKLRSFAGPCSLSQVCDRQCVGGASPKTAAPAASPSHSTEARAATGLDLDQGGLAGPRSA